MAEEIDYPSLQQQGKNLAKFTFEVLKEAMKGGQEKLFVGADVQKKRLDICKTCTYYDPSQGRCKHCGCFLLHKVKFSLESCPIEKWSVSDEDWLNDKFEEVAEKVLNPDPEINRPRFPLDVIIGDKYSWSYPEPDGRTMHWFWNGATWEFDPDPSTPNYSDEEIAIYRGEKEQRRMEEEQRLKDQYIRTDKEELEAEWDRHLRREAGEDIPDESMFSTDGNSLPGLIAQYRANESTNNDNEEIEEEMENVDDEEVNLIDSIISDIMTDSDVIENALEQPENTADTGEENVPIDPMIDTIIADMRTEFEEEIKTPEAPVKKKRTYKKKTTTATDTTESTTPKKKRGRPKKVKTEENTETTE